MSASLSPKKEEELPKLNKEEESQTKKVSSKLSSLVSDCGSSLYDSYELNSFTRQLESAVVSRTLSMPHLSDHKNHRRTLPPLPTPPKPPPTQPVVSSKKPWKFSRSFQRLLGSIFRSKQGRHSVFKGQEKYYFVYDTSSALTTIPEAPESGGDHGGVSPDVNSLVRTTASDRFTAAASVGISCA